MPGCHLGINVTPPNVGDRSNDDYLSSENIIEKVGRVNTPLILHSLIVLSTVNLFKHFLYLCPVDRIV